MVGELSNMTNSIWDNSELYDAVHQFMLALFDDSAESDFTPIIDLTDKLPLTHLDKWERQLRTGIFPLALATQPSAWTRLTRKPPTKTQRAITWLDLCSYDGFARERALSELSGGAPNALFFALALRRLNDWVPQVRIAARLRLLSMAAETPSEQVVDGLFATLPYWQGWGRLTNADRDVLLEITSIEAVAELIKLRIVSTPAGPIPGIFVQIGRTDVLDSALPTIAQNAVQPAVRARAYRALLEEKMSWLEGYDWVWVDKRWGKRKAVPRLAERPLKYDIPFLDVMKQAIADRSPMVRRVAGAALIEQRHSIGPELATMAAMLASDANPSVAENGQFILDRLRDEG